jgi:hypothetical protein
MGNTQNPHIMKKIILEAIAPFNEIAGSSVGRPEKVLRLSFLIALLLACLGLAPMAQAVGPDTEGAIAGSNNGEGVGVLVSRTTGIWNTGTGFEALNHLTSGNQNTATGLRALSSDINGGFNTATGVYSLFSNTSGFFNSATGAYSLANNTEGNYNTANGYAALYRNTKGEFNTATGYAALYHNTTGEFNAGNGYSAPAGATPTGSLNTANGYQALYNNTTGSGNTANGYLALYNYTTGDTNTAFGNFAGLSITGNNNVCIGAGVTGVAGVNDTTWISNVYTTVQPVVGTDPDVVTVNSSGRLGRANVSSRRYKHDIKPMDKASEALYALNPVSFRYNKQYDATQTLAFGLIAEEVAEVYPDLVGRNPDGQLESVRYEQINAMLLNEFLKEHRTVEEQGRKAKEQEATITQLKQDFQSKLAAQEKQIKALASGLERVSAQLEVSRPAPRPVAHTQQLKTPTTGRARRRLRPRQIL